MSFFGEGCLAGQPLRLASASANTESAIVRIEKDAMIRALRDEPTFSQLFMAYLLSRNVQIEADLVDQLFNSSEKRLARVLLLLAHFGKDGEDGTRHSPDQSGDIGGAGGYDAVADQLLHEQIPQARLHRVQRRIEGTLGVDERDRPRLAAADRRGGRALHAFTWVSARSLLAPRAS